MWKMTDSVADNTMYKHKDIFLSTGIYMWFQLKENGEDLTLVTVNNYNGGDGGDGGDSSVNRGNAAFIGDMPEGLVDITTELGWDSAFYVAFTTEESGLGWVFDTSWTEWALRNGVAPYQPFLIKMDGLPTYYATCDEWDVDFAPWEIVEKEPWSAFEVSRHWEHWFMMRTRYRERARVQMRRLLYLRKHDLNAMYISVDTYWPRGCVEGCFPDGLRVSLYSRHTSVEGFNKCAWNSLAEGRDDTGNRGVALNRLIEKVRETLPHLSEEFIRVLAKR